MDALKRCETDSNGNVFHLGIDIGSTTTKTVVIDPSDNEALFSRYSRHNACQAQSLSKALEEVISHFPNARFRIAVCGSGGNIFSDLLNVPYVQEVVANSIAVRKAYIRARTAIELGGQDAKIIFFDYDESIEQLVVDDMRMNGSCAGGTGAFIDEIATLLNVAVEDFEDLAQTGNTVYDISGRCGVYAKTDIQPLLNQGVPKADIALSTFHAIAKQTIGGLAQGIDIKSPVIFEGGPLTFNPTLTKVFMERLDLSESDVIVPEEAETIVALGTALAIDELFLDAVKPCRLSDVVRLIRTTDGAGSGLNDSGQQSFFETPEEYQDFKERHKLINRRPREHAKGTTLDVYLGIDSGSTTTKFVLLDEEEKIVDQFYASNEGEPLMVAQKALSSLYDTYQRLGVSLNIKSLGTTGYGELLFARAFSADFHVVETVAHAEAARKYVPDVSFILDIGGQDMKAIMLDDGIITDIIVNEECSSGCGSFLESFAATLDIPVESIAEAAFSAENPAELGSRCTVFMNSRIVTEQKNGKTPNDIMAGLCRSIIENVFTKVVRIPNLDKLGKNIVVQGGTFNNDAVLRAFEQYVGREIIRAPYPGIMGAIGVALLAKKSHNTNRKKQSPSQEKPSSFIGFDGVKQFSFTQESSLACPFCSNHCLRTSLSFPNGSSWITGNRCEKGQIIGAPSDPKVRSLLQEMSQEAKESIDLFALRQKMLFREYPCIPLADRRNVRIGLPRVLEFWNSMPFWTTFFQALGFDVSVSDSSTRKMYEKGLSAVTSDTVCFPAKLVHGHVRNLAEKKVDRIFLPSITCMESENTEKTSESVCAVVKGYPIVLANSDNPENRWNIPFDHPLFHWYTEQDRNKQLSDYMKDTFGIDSASCLKAIAQGDSALRLFKNTMQARGASILEEVEREGNFAVVLASRPYQNDELVNHRLSKYFTTMGIPVLTVDSIPGIYDEDLSGSRLDIVNNFHARMLSSALIAAQSPYLEYVQLVSFGCGHDALLSDEIIRLMKEKSGKTPLILKLDESDIQGPLHIRVESFIETVKARRALNQELPQNNLPDPYPAKYEERHQQERIILVPNVSRAFCRIMTAAIAKQGVRAEPLPLGGEEAIRLGKKYVHNDICFPAQMTIGEALAALESGLYNPDEVAMGTGKLIGDCRLTHYAALLRKALDDAGYSQVPIITNDGEDKNGLHPGYRMSIGTQIRIAIGLPMIDALEQLLRKIRPYELKKGEADHAFQKAIDVLAQGIETDGVRGAIRSFRHAIRLMKEVRYDRSQLKSPVLVVGEYLLSFHPGSNNNLEAYLEANNMEVIEPSMTDVYRKGYFYQASQIKEYKIKKPFSEASWLFTADGLFEFALNITDRIAKKHPLFEPSTRLPELTKKSDQIMHHTFDSGEGFLIPAEILHHAEKGVRSFVILQPFGCLPNHICGRGVTKRLKEMYPSANILPLDFDPDTSFANIENRLQMLIMNAKSHEVPVAYEAVPESEESLDDVSWRKQIDLLTSIPADISEEISKFTPSSSPRSTSSHA